MGLQSVWSRQAKRDQNYIEITLQEQDFGHKSGQGGWSTREVLIRLVLRLVHLTTFSITNDV